MLSNAVDEMMCNNIPYHVNGNREKYPNALVRNFQLIVSLIPLIHLYCSDAPYYITWYFSASSINCKAGGGKKKKLPKPP